MQNERLPSLAFRIAPGTSIPRVNLAVNIPDKQSSSLPGSSKLLSFAALLARFVLQASRDETVRFVEVDATAYGKQNAMFDAAWNFVKNAFRPDPRVKAGELLEWAGASITARQSKLRSPSNFVEFDLAHFPMGNVWFGVVDAAGASVACDTDEKLEMLFRYLTGAAGSFLANENASGGSREFFFGSRPTGTHVIRSFPDGLPIENVRCRLTADPFRPPFGLEPLIDKAQARLRHNAPGVLVVPDQAMLAPRHLQVEMHDMNEKVTLDFALGDSSYRYYSSFAFANCLADRDSEFAPLADFVKLTPDPDQPAPATCSMGVRVLVETSDKKLVVAHRSRQVKMNPDVWSSSANEGIRRDLLKVGDEPAELLEIAVARALQNELRLQSDEWHSPVVLSIYRNAFNQWGIGLCVRSEFDSETIISRQRFSTQAFEHKQMAALPLDVEACGRAMLELGTRWYGGALETICNYFSWRESTNHEFYPPDKISRKLAAAAGNAIQPIDEVNSALLVSEEKREAGDSISANVV